ncbi:AI-2E family transporter [Prosthecobacter dejongeii]|uniref:Putative PurR-regulated permease PerM n=1 Tax=Prosthecobacter dejongeii TaxID=48465 RepID=A0A7W7YQE2_9BACT|nr:AI-2E family transporter [Prosthecobacter dejongeii]MBB5040420.1 putative PurR-regulated permease PerM [Prosthecobacter dejongeii]
MIILPEQDKTVDWGRKGSQMILTLACLVIVLAGMKAAAGVLVPMVYAFFLAVLSFPLLRWLTRHRIPGPVALAMTLLVNLGVLAGLITLAVRLLISFNSDLPRYLRGIQRNLTDLGVWLDDNGIEGAKEMMGSLFDWNTIIGYATQQDVMSRIGAMLGSTFGTLATVFAGLVMILILMMFVLMEATGTQRRIAAVRTSGGPDFSGLMRSVTDIQKYLGIKTLISALTGLLAGVWCWFFDLQYPLLWAILAFIFNYIPAVGSSAASIPAIVEALVQHGGGAAIGIALGYGGINFALDNFVQPQLLGNRFGISALVVVLSVIFWGWLWGPMGMFLAVPLTMVMKVLLDNSEEFRWVSVAMSQKKMRRGEVEVVGYDLDENEMVGGGASTESPRHD